MRVNNYKRELYFALYIIFWISICVCFLCQSTNANINIYNEVIVEDFEDGILHERDINPKENGYVWYLTNYAGNFSWNIDNETAARNSKYSLKMTVNSTVPYWYYLDNYNNRDNYILGNYRKPLNRMEFWIKLPKNWKRDCPLLINHTYCYYNFHIGTYERDPNVRLRGFSATETYGWHFYYHIVFDMFDDNWTRVKINKRPRHKRNNNYIIGFNPTRPRADMFQHWSSIYFTGSDYYTPAYGVTYPYNVWFDEWRFYYERDYISIFPHYYIQESRSGVNLSNHFVIINTDPERARKFALDLNSQLYRSDNYWTYDIRIYNDDNNNGVWDPDETNEISETPLLGPMESFSFFVVNHIPSHGTGSNTGAIYLSELAVYQIYPDDDSIDPHISPGKISHYGVVSNDTELPGIPITGASIETIISDALQNDLIPPSPISDMIVMNISPYDAEIGFTAPGDDGNVGNAFAYEIRYSTVPITEDTWNEAIPFDDIDPPRPSGEFQRIFLPPYFSPCTTYYVAMKSYDEMYNPSEMSNVVSFTTPCINEGQNNPPVALFNVSTVTGESPLYIKFDSQSFDSDGNIILYLWDFGDGKYSNNPDPAHVYDKIGTYNVSLTVFDNACGVDREFFTITVNRGPRGTIIAKTGTVNGIRNRNDILKSHNLLGYYGYPTRLLLRFSDIRDTLAIPENSSVKSAYIRIYHMQNTGGMKTITDPFGDRNTNKISVYLLNRDFDPNRVRWTMVDDSEYWDVPGILGGSDIDHLITNLSIDRFAGLYRYINITDELKDALNENKNLSILMVFDQEDENGIFITIASENDPEHRPALIVNYESNSSLCIHESDENCDGCIDQMELLSYIQKWLLSTDIPVTKLIQAVAMWKHGCGK